MPEIRRLLRALREDPAHFGFHVDWSHWRRRHQAVARHGHVTRRARRLAALAPPCADGAAAPPGAVPLVSRDLTEADWARIAPLLPPEKPRRGRPAHAHRPLVTAMLWVERTGASWRQVPSDVGPWHRVYNRYRRWRISGLWARIQAVLTPAPAATTLTPAHAPPADRAA